MDYKYSLATKGKWICPECGKRTFVLYVDGDENPLGLSVGKCDRADNCAFHYTPKMFFRDHGNMNNRFERPRPKWIRPMPKVERPTYHDPKSVRESMMNGMVNNLVTFLKSVFTEPGEDKRIVEVLNEYYLGNNDHWQGATVFWRIDQFGNIHSGKVMLYDPATGKRVKEPFNKVTWFHTIKKIQGFKISPCLFGQHLIGKIDQGDNVIVVESEKTAILTRLAFSDGLGVATGGSENFQKKNCKTLRGCKVIVIPDQGKFHEWRSRALEIKPICQSIRVLDIMEYESRNDGDDIGDLIVEVWQNHCQSELLQMLKRSFSRCKPL